MPIFKIGSQLHFFAHVPKCGGTSVEGYIQQRFGPMAFLDQHHLDKEPLQIWSRSPPQHITMSALERLVPESWITSSFAVVRDPLSRFVSAFNYGVNPLRQIPVGMSIEEWFDEYLSLAKYWPFYNHGHLTRQTDLVPKTAKWFKLEEGLEALARHIDVIAGEADNCGSMPTISHREAVINQASIRKTFSSSFINRFTAHYACDYDAFGYKPSPNRAFQIFVPAVVTEERAFHSQALQFRSHAYRICWRYAALASRGRFA